MARLLSRDPRSRELARSTTSQLRWPRGAQAVLCFPLAPMFTTQMYASSRLKTDVVSMKNGDSHLRNPFALRGSLRETGLCQFHGGLRLEHGRQYPNKSALRGGLKGSL